MEFNDEVMHKVWAYEQDILDVIHKVCKENHLRYSLFYGTLLGAVRHGGFIPWDDDIDIAIPREDYIKLLEIWDNCAPEGYIMQQPDKVSGYTNTFAKVCKNHTTFLQFEKDRKCNYHKGIYVDIFPLDRVPYNKIMRKVQYVCAAFYLLYARGYTSGDGGIVGMIEKILLKVPKLFYPTLRDFFGEIVQIWDDNQKLKYVSFCTIRSAKIYFEPDMFSSLMQIPFAEKQYFSIQDSDTALRILYGDYMQLPPEEERVWKHHPILIDFEHNYEEIAENSTN